MYVAETIEILQSLDVDAVDRVATGLAEVRERNARLFVLGVGGSAGHASHAVNDFRKLCGIEAYAPTDNVSELTARTNDEGWETSLSGWLEVSRLGPDDAVLVFSVGGGDAERNISPNLVRALELAGTGRRVRVRHRRSRRREHRARRRRRRRDSPPLYSERITPHTEGLCAVVWHLLVSHPTLQRSATKWESATGSAEVP